VNRCKGTDAVKFGLAALLAVLLTGCSSSPERSEEGARKAAETNTALGRSYMERGQYEIALDKLKRAVAHDKTYAPAHTLLGVLYETIGEADQAEKEYRKAVQYDPSDGDVNNNLGAFLCGRGERKEAEAYFLVAVKDPFYTTPEVALSNAGSCALAAGDLDKAEAFLRQSLEYDDKLASALLSMTQVSFRKESYLRARAFLQRYEEVGPATEESLVMGYRIESRLGDEVSAERYRAAISQQYPNALGAGEPSGREKE
jgi:type IV pilus assembly protein PilF